MLNLVGHKEILFLPIYNNALHARDTKLMQREDAARNSNNAPQVPDSNSNPQVLVPQVPGGDSKPQHDLHLLRRHGKIRVK